MEEGFGCYNLFIWVDGEDWDREGMGKRRLVSCRSRRECFEVILGGYMKVYLE